MLSFWVNLWLKTTLRLQDRAVLYRLSRRELKDGGVRKSNMPWVAGSYVTVFESLPPFFDMTTNHPVYFRILHLRSRFGKHCCYRTISVKTCWAAELSTMNILFFCLEISVSYPCKEIITFLYIVLFILLCRASDRKLYLSPRLRRKTTSPSASMTLMVTFSFILCDNHLKKDCAMTLLLTSKVV